MEIKETMRKPIWDESLIRIKTRVSAPYTDSNYIAERCNISWCYVEYAGHRFYFRLSKQVVDNTDAIRTAVISTLNYHKYLIKLLLNPLGLEQIVNEKYPIEECDQPYVYTHIKQSMEQARSRFRERLLQQLEDFNTFIENQKKYESDYGYFN